MEHLLLILPLLFSLSILVVPKNFTKVYSLLGGIASLVLTIILWSNYNPTSGFHLFIDLGKNGFGMTTKFGYDGIALVMLLLTNLLIPIILLANYKNALSENKRFASMVFLMQLGLNAVFLALDAVWFYIAWEITLIPIFLIAYWFGAPERKAAMMKFFIYTFVGSLAMLASIIGLGKMLPLGGDYSYESIVGINFENGKLAFWMMTGFMAAFAVKIPLFPFHTWQPDTYSKAPMAGTMLLSGIMLKMALYGILRWVLPVFPEALCCGGSTIILLGVIGVVYGAILAIMQSDMKRMFAFASLSHVGLIAAGLFVNDSATLSGAVLQMFNHGLIAVGLFLAVDIIERRVGTRKLDELGGIAKQAPKFAFWFLALCMASVSVPFTSGFIGEFLLLKGLYEYQWIIGIVAGSTLIFGAVYTFRAYQRSMNGPVVISSFEDLHWSELGALAIIVLATLALGLFPGFITDFVKPSLDNLLETIAQSSTICGK